MSEVAPGERREFKEIDGEQTYPIVVVALKQPFTGEPSYWIELHYCSSSGRYYLLVQWSFLRRQNIPVVGSHVYTNISDLASIIEAYKTKFSELTSKNRGSPWVYHDHKIMIEGHEPFLLAMNHEDRNILNTLSVLFGKYAADSSKDSGSGFDTPDLSISNDLSIRSTRSKLKTVPETFKDVQKRNKAKAKW